MEQEQPQEAQAGSLEGDLSLAPDYAGVLMGVRAWGHSGGGYLLSPFHLDQWEGIQAAQCGPGINGHEVPQENCGCGFYAYYTYPDYKWNSIFHSRDEVVVGVVSAWGKVVLHEEGFRARFMKVEAIIAGGKPEEEKLISMMYDVPVLKRGEVQKFCEERGVVEPLGKRGLTWRDRTRSFSSRLLRYSLMHTQ